MGAFGLNLDPTLFFIHPLLLREPLVCFHNGPSQNKQNILAAGRMACLSCNQSSRTTPWKPSRVAHRSAVSVNSNPSANGQKIDFVVYWDVYDWSLWDDHFLNGLVRFNRGPPFPIGEPVKNKSGEGGGDTWSKQRPLLGLCLLGVSWIGMPKVISHIAIGQMWREEPHWLRRDNISFI